MHPLRRVGVSLLLLCSLAGGVLAVGLGAAAVTAQVPLERFRPLAVGSHWIYRTEGYSHLCLSPITNCDFTAELRVVRDTTISNIDNLIINCKLRNEINNITFEEDYLIFAIDGSGWQPASLSATNVCRHIDIVGRMPFWEVSPPRTVSVIEPGDIFIGNILYQELPSVRRSYYTSPYYPYPSDEEILTMVHVADVGLISMTDIIRSRHENRNRRATLRYASVGGVEYGVNPFVHSPPPEPEPEPGPDPEPSLSAYPVPASGAVRIELVGATDEVLRVYDAMGREVHAERFSAEALTLDLRGWTPGVYVARSSVEGRLYLTRFIVAR